MSLYYGPGWINPRNEPMPSRTPRVSGITVKDGKIAPKPARMVAGQSRAKLEAKAKKEEAAWAAKSKGQP